MPTFPDLPKLRSADRVVGVVASDCHFSHKVPIARSAEPDWYAAQERVLEQIKFLCTSYTYQEKPVPFIIAGDVVDKPEQPPELINFLLRLLPDEVIAVAGQHDLLHHNITDIHKSAYWTLCEAGKIQHIEKKLNLPCQIRLYGFSWQQEIVPPKLKTARNVAIIHSYIWMKGCSYTGVEMETSVKSWSKKLYGYDSAFFGDNHKGFFQMTEVQDGSEPWIMNCGAMIRRKADEINYQPQVGLLLESGTFTTVNLPTDEDKWLDVDKALDIIESGAEVAEFLDELGSLGGSALNFIDAVMAFLKHHKVGGAVRDKITKLMESKR
jgi:hypothetical protein